MDEHKPCVLSSRERLPKKSLKATFGTSFDLGALITTLLTSNPQELAGYRCLALIVDTLNRADDLPQLLSTPSLSSLIQSVATALPELGPIIETLRSWKGVTQLRETCNFLEQFITYLCATTVEFVLVDTNCSYPAELKKHSGDLVLYTLAVRDEYRELFEDNLLEVTQPQDGSRKTPIKTQLFYYCRQMLSVLNSASKQVHRLRTNVDKHIRYFFRGRSSPKHKIRSFGEVMASKGKSPSCSPVSPLDAHQFISFYNLVNDVLDDTVSNIPAYELLVVMVSNKLPLPTLVAAHENAPLLIWTNCDSGRIRSRPYSNLHPLGPLPPA